MQNAQIEHPTLDKVINRGWVSEVESRHDGVPLRFGSVVSKCPRLDFSTVAR